MINPNEFPDEEMSFNLNDIMTTVTNATTESKPDSPVEDSNMIDDVTNTIEASLINPENIKSNEDKTSTEQPTQYNESGYLTALNILKESGIFEIPDNVEVVDDEIWNAIVEDNKNKYKQSIIEELRSNAGDSKIVELFDYVYNGGTWFGAEQMIDTIQDEINVESLDTTQEEHQRYLIESYLSEGLDPNNPAHFRRLENLPNEVNSIFERLEADTIAEEAKSYFLNKISEQKAQLAAQQEEYVKQQQLAEQEHKRQQAEWANTFKNTLNERGWNETKKKEIVSQFDIVELDNGNKVPMWKYKFDSIWANPKATQVFMDFISDFDPYTHEFKRNGVPAQKQATSLIQELINTKNQNKSKGEHSNQRQVATTIKTIDPRIM